MVSLRNTLLRQLAVLLVAAFTLYAASALAAAAQPNVLLIVSDDLRDTVGCYGNEMVKTPNIDRLARRGVRFERAFAQYPVCNPSRSSFMTGLRCEQTGVVGNGTFFRSRLPDIVTLPQLLRQHGWYAASYGKIYHVGEAAGEVRDRWFDIGKSWDEAKMFHPTERGRRGNIRNLTGGKLKWCEVGAMEGDDDDQPDGQNALHAIRAIEQQTAAGKSWFIGAGFHRPHDPFLVPKKYFDLYPPGSLKLYRDPTNITPVPPLSMPGGGFTQAFNAFTDEERLEFQRAYYAGVSFMDAQVGRLLDTLDRLKLWDSTIVIFAGDNGYHHNERNWWNKNTLFERSCRVPLIVAAPGAKAGQAASGLVELVDLYPTIIDYCGLKAPHALAGQTLRPVLTDPARPGKPAAYTLVMRGRNQYGQTVRTARWRYTRWSDGTTELYDETADPEETRNLAKEPQAAASLPALQKLLEAVGPFSAGGSATSADAQTELLRWETIYDSAITDETLRAAFRRQFAELRPKVAPNANLQKAGVWKVKAFAFRELDFAWKDKRGTNHHAQYRYREDEIERLRRGMAGFADRVWKYTDGHLRIDWELKVIEQPLTKLDGEDTFWPGPDACMPHLREVKTGEADTIMVFAKVWGDTRKGEVSADVPEMLLGGALGALGELTRNATYIGFNWGSGAAENEPDGEPMLHEWLHSAQWALEDFQGYPRGLMFTSDGGKMEGEQGGDLCYRRKKSEPSWMGFYEHIMRSHVTRRMWRELSVTRPPQNAWKKKRE